jgi:hypothetical protein
MHSGSNGENPPKIILLVFVSTVKSQTVAILGFLLIKMVGHEAKDL